MKQLRNHQLGAKTAVSEAVRGIVNLPTGTGKTIIQSRSISDDISANTGVPKVYVVLSPRIILSNQLVGEVKDDLIRSGQDNCKYLVVHSGFVDDAMTDIEEELNLKYNSIPSTLSPSVIEDEWKKAEEAGTPLIISSTYHSAERVAQSGVPVEVVFCDEAHYLVQEQFAWIVHDPFPAQRAFFFTATLRVTASIDGMGMNNVELFGNILYQDIPINLIDAGEMLRTRMHLVYMTHSPEADEADGTAVVEAFNQHQSELNIGAKMLVVSKDGSDLLDELANHPEVRELSEQPNVTIFDISSEHGNRVNGEKRSRSEFLTELQALKSHEQAIIIHCDILSEGIDVPGITGIMPLRSLKKAKFLQTLGRATRLHPDDRARLYSGEIVASELAKMVKPYAWLIIPVYGDLGADLHEEMRNYILELRDYGFNPSEDILVRQRRGQGALVPIREVNDPPVAVTQFVDVVHEVMHEIESEADASSWEVKEQQHADMDLDELVGSFLGMAA